MTGEWDGWFGESSRVKNFKSMQKQGLKMPHDIISNNLLWKETKKKSCLVCATRFYGWPKNQPVANL